MIGGCSSHNGCIALWGSREDYDCWADDGNDGWSTEEVLPHFRKAAARLRVSHVEPEEITPFHGACLEETAGMVTAEDLRRDGLHYFQPVGTCKMGPDSDPAAVVNPLGRVYGAEGLFVADASIMPVVPRANTNLPALMVAERIVAALD